MSELGRLVTELQVRGVVDPAIAGTPIAGTATDGDLIAGNRGRRGGAGPSDHRALSFGDTTVMVLSLIHI